MKKALILAVLFVGVFSYARCPSTEIICEDNDNYSIVEAEERSYGRHNQMEMEHKYPDFVNNGESADGCGSGCSEFKFQKIEDRTIAFVR